MDIRIFTQKNKRSQNGSSEGPFSCPQNRPLFGTVLAPLCDVEPFHKKENWKWCLFFMKSTFENGSSLPGGTVFFLNMIMKKKMAKEEPISKMAPLRHCFGSTFFLSADCLLFRPWCKRFCFYVGSSRKNALVQSLVRLWACTGITQSWDGQFPTQSATHSLISFVWHPHVMSWKTSINTQAILSPYVHVWSMMGTYFACKPDIFDIHWKQLLLLLLETFSTVNWDDFDHFYKKCIAPTSYALKEVVTLHRLNSALFQVVISTWCNTPFFTVYIFPWGSWLFYCILRKGLGTPCKGNV